LDGSGLVGRVTGVGQRSASILLITDINSRIPVTLARGHARALMVGSNGPDPRLIYWPEGSLPAEGERVVTSGVGGVFPPGLPVGRVHLGPGGTVRVVPAAHLGRLEMVRLFDYHALLMPHAGRKGP
ncbi:MAG: rod shape-determining protein MreC, partial [Acetobacteraceae bacterium]